MKSFPLNLTGKDWKFDFSRENMKTHETSVKINHISNIINFVKASDLFRQIISELSTVIFTHLRIISHLIDGRKGGNTVSWILMMRLGQHLLVGSRWAQIAGRLCWVIAGGGDVLVVATRIGGAAEGRERERERGKCKWNQNSVTVDNANDDDDDDEDTDVVHVWCGDKLTPDAHVRTVGVVGLSLSLGGWTPARASVYLLIRFDGQKHFRFRV